jgi:hypothetical protein
MINRLLIELALVSTPFLLFLAYRAIVGARRQAAGGVLDETPYQILFLAGSALSLIALVAVVLLGPDDAGHEGQIYIPPHMEDGQLVQGQFITREEAVARGLIASDEDVEAYYRRTRREAEEEAGEEAPFDQIGPDLSDSPQAIPEGTDG